MTHFSTAMTIFVGAFAMLRQNVRGIAQHIGLAYLLWIVGTIAIQGAAFGRLTNEPLILTVDNAVAEQNASIALILFAYLFHSAVYIYIAVAWHRVALQPDAVRPSGPQIWLYLWRLVQQTFILVVPIVTFVAVNVFASVSVITGAIYNEALWPFALNVESVLNFVFAVCIGWVMLRFGLILPAAAVEDWGYGLGASWKDTARFAWPLLWIAVFEAGMWLAITWASDAIGLFDEAVEFVVFTAIWPLPFLLGLSVLTYLYQGQADDAA